MGFGGLLLGAVTARFAADVDPDLLGDLNRLIHQVEAGQRVPQPRLRHRLQADRIGLTSHRHRLVGTGDRIDFDLDTRGKSLPNVLGAVYTAGRLSGLDRSAAFGAIRRGIAWRGTEGDLLVTRLGAETFTDDFVTLRGSDPRAWALALFGLTEATVDKPSIHRRFRELVRAAHPDHGGDAGEAAARLGDLARARRILTQG